MPWPARILALIAAAFAASAIHVPALAEDFRVETKVFVGKETRAVSENLTLFRAGKVYDFLTRADAQTVTFDKQINVYDRRAGRFVLLDPIRHVKTEITADRLSKFMVELKTWAAQQSDPLLKFAAAPDFDEKSGENPDELIFSGTGLTYRVTTQHAERADSARQYQEFCDAFAQLNALLNPGSLPPFPRMEIDQVLGERGLLPREIELTVLPRQRFASRAVIKRSEHRLHGRLLDSDVQRIDEAGEFLVKFPTVTLDEFQQPVAAEARK